jgi:hypothetical protein
MAVPLLSSCGCVPCGFQLRSVGAELEPGGDFTNMVAWVNLPFPDIDTIPWGQCLTGGFTDPSHTVPDGTAYNLCDGGVGYPTNLTQCVGFNEDGTACVGGQPCAVPTVYRTQFYLPFPTAYYVLAYGSSITASEYADCGGGGYWLSRGCIYPQQDDDQYPMIVELNIPESSLDDTIQVQFYFLGPITPGATIPPEGIFVENMTPLPNLTSLTVENANVSGLGANWASSIANPCYASPGDPFDDSDPP